MTQAQECLLSWFERLPSITPLLTALLSSAVTSWLLCEPLPDTVAPASVDSQKLSLFKEIIQKQSKSFGLFNSAN